MNRPKRITVIGILLLVFFGMASLGNICSLIYLLLARLNPELSTAGLDLQYVLVMKIIGFLLKVGMIVGAIALLKLQDIGRIIIIVCSLATIGAGTIHVARATIAGKITLFPVLSLLATTLLLGWLTVFLLKNKTKELFVLNTASEN